MEVYTLAQLREMFPRTAEQLAAELKPDERATTADRIMRLAAAAQASQASQAGDQDKPERDPALERDPLAAAIAAIPDHEDGWR